jgi:hypothetical protein
MTDLTPQDHTRIRANAWLMWQRQLADWGGPVAIPSAVTADERPKPPEPGPHAHRRDYAHYTPKAKGGRR